MRCLASLGYTPILTSSGEVHTIIRAKSPNELDCGNASGTAELSLLILSSLE